MLGIIGTRSVTKEIPGIVEIKARNRERIVSGIEAVKALEALRRAPEDKALRAAFDAHKDDLGFGLLLRRYVTSMDQVTPEIIDRAARDTIPAVAPMFWTFRLMVAIGFSLLLLFTLALWHSAKNTFANKRWLLRWARAVGAHALARRRARLVRRGIRPAAVDDLRRAAHPPLGLDAFGRPTCTARSPALSASTRCCSSPRST